jgi:SdrD B-like domain/Secretion system C-terminal sorting domain
MSNFCKGILMPLKLLVCFTFFANIVLAQNFYYAGNETFPNYTILSGWPSTQTFTGSSGTWTATANQSYCDIDVLNYTYRYSPSNAVRIQNYSGASTSTASITSPTLNLAPYVCSPKADLTFSLYTDKITASSCSYYKIDVSGDGGATWANAWQQTTAQLLASAPNPTGWNDYTILINSSYLTNNFKYRFVGVSNGGCGLNNEIWIDDITIRADACRTKWINQCSDNKDVDLYTKGMANNCVNGSMGWTNIGTSEGLIMTNATQVKLYVSTSEAGNPTRTVTVRSKNASGTVLETQTLSIPTNNQDDPSPINIYDFTFTSLSGVTNFEATVSGGCSVSNSSTSFIANGMGMAVFRSSITGTYNMGEMKYWGAPGNGVWDYSKLLTFPITSYAKDAIIELNISGLYNNGKGVRVKIDGPNGTITKDIFNTDATSSRITKAIIVYPNIPASSDNLYLYTDASFDQNGMYSIDATKVEVTCSQPLNLGNIVFNDANNNGVKDGAETGIPGITVNLYNDANADNIADGLPVQTTITDASGNYAFRGLLAGNYIVGVVISNGYTTAVTTGQSNNPNNNNDNDNNGVNLVNGGTEVRSNNITLSIGGEPTTDGDDANGNLTLDFGLKTTACVKTIETFPNTFNSSLATSVNGTYTGSSGTWAAYSNARASTAVITPSYAANAVNPFAIKMVGYNTNAGSGDGYAEQTSPTINIASNCCPLQTKLNFTLWTHTCSIDDIWSNFNVSYSADGGTTWSVAYSITASKMYELYGSEAKVNLSIPIATSFQTNNFKYRVSMYKPNNQANDFYIFLDDFSISSPITCGTGSISNFVWNDANMNGVQDLGEAGMTGVVVTLKDDNGTTITTTTTNASGNYIFSNLPAGNYQVAFTTPTGFNPTWYDLGGDDTKDSDPIGGTIKNVKLTNGQVRTDIDAGFFAICSTLFSETFPNTYNTTYTTPTNGTFVGSLGTYTVASTNGYSGLVVETNGSINYVKTLNYYDASGTFSQVRLTSPTLDLVQGAGCTQWVYLNFEMYPLYINTPVGSDSYKVYIDFSGDNGTTWTNGWAMNGADIINYYGLGQIFNVSVSLPSTAYTTTFKYRLRTEQQAVATCDNYVYFDNFQIRKCPCPSLNLGNNVWFDANNNGIKDAGEPGIATATVNLYQDNNGDNVPDGAAVSTTTTNASGVYSFTNLVAGNYIVGVVLPTGTVATVTTGTSANPNNDTDNDNNGVTTVSGELRSNYITLSTNGEPAVGVDGDGTNGNLTLDFGIKGALNIGNLVWDDIDGNGIKNTYENGINNVTLYLYQDANGDNIPDGAAINTTITNSSGVYGFTNLIPGNYIVGYTPPTKYSNSTTPTSGTNPNNDTDNDNNGVTYFTSSIVTSNFITLTVGGEPATGVDGDGTNGNLTLDFACALDNDNDRRPNVLDIDDDNDGITDVNESGGYDPLADCDGDGTPNYLDATPGCATPSGNDPWGKPYKTLTWTDCNSDGINDFFDFDGDGIINELDLDSDGDGILDVQEARPNSVAVTNTNGQITGTDADKNGLLSAYDNGNANPVLNGIAAQDLDRDGRPNFLDLDSDGDGITDATEALGTYDSDGLANGTDTDGDGVRAENFSSSAANISDNLSGFGAKGFTLLDSDADGKPDAYDIDSDNDGITDDVEGQPTCSFKLPTGIDCDGDGVDNAYDVSTCITCGKSSGGVTPFDKDGDGTPDYLDLDTDNDGAPDVNEGSKQIGNFVTNTADTDGDGLIDQFDVFNIKTALSNFTNNVGHNQMGANGSFDGPVPSGSNAQLVESDGLGGCVGGGERDWRTGTILPLHIIRFTGVLSNNKVILNWDVTNETDVHVYTIERSIDGITFTSIASTPALNRGSSLYTHADDIGSLKAEKIFYRIKQVNKSGQIFYTNVIVFKIGSVLIKDLKLYPNPAKTYVILLFTSDKNQQAEVAVFNTAGQKVIKLKQQLQKGMNTITIYDVANLANGIYVVQVNGEDDIYTGRFVK